MDSLDKKALLRMSTKTQNFLKSLDVVLPFFVFKFFNDIYKDFLVYLIARLNLAINEQSEKFWYGINDKVNMGSMGKHRGRMAGAGEHREFGRVWMMEELGNFW